MRVALVCHEFRSEASLHLSSHSRGLASALARAGLEVEVFTLEAHGERRLTQRRRLVPVKDAAGTLAVTAVAADGSESPAELAAAFGAFLDRERPALCHFESIAAFGAPCLGEARDRGLPTVYCARDPWPAHDQATLTLPNLAPFELGDCEAEARGEVALELCRSIPDGGGVPADPGERLLLRELLEGDKAALASRPELARRVSEAHERIQEARAGKRALLSSVDRRFAASRMLARQLSATVGRAFTPRIPGVEPAAARMEERSGDAARARVLFLGSSRPVEGLGVLLDALRELLATPEREAPSLRVVLEATDPLRDAALATRAEALGVEFECKRGALDVPRALGGIDALIFPARWGQFAPVSVRVAQAVGLPVVASAIPGIEEFAAPESSVLVEPGDVGQLAEALATIAHRAGRLGELREAALHRAVSEAGSGPLKGLDAEAQEWRQTYEQLLGARPSRGPIAGPPHVQEFEAELARMGEASLGDLFERVELGLEQLRAAFGLSEETASLMARAVARGGPLRDQAGDADGGQGEPLLRVGDALELGKDLVPRPGPGDPVAGAAVATEADPAGQDELARQEQLTGGTTGEGPGAQGGTA
jgi:hypothetical protein